MESPQPNSKSRRQLRFNNHIQEKEYQPVNDEEGSPLRSVPDENVFRVPLPPKLAHVREPMIQKTNTFANNFEDGLDSDNNTKAKYLQKMKQLEERRAKASEAKKSKQKTEIVEPANNKLDISLTEQSFLSTAHGYPNPIQSEFRLSNVSSIHPFETTFTQSSDNNLFGPVSSTPFRETVSQTKKPVTTAPVVSTVLNGGCSSTSFVPTNDVSIMYETYEEKLDRQMKALTVWCNIILKCDLDIAEIDLGKSKKEADQKLQDLLTKPSKCEQANQEVAKKFSYKDFLKKQERDAIMEKALKCYKITNIPIKIREMVNRREVAIRDDCAVYCNISLMKTLLRVFLSFNPFWLHLGLEIVFNEKISIGEGELYASVLSKFISTRLFTDPAIMKNKKFAQGTVKMIVTPAGREALHAHFLTHACQYFFFVEYAKSVGVFEHNPRMFNKSSTYKCLEDVFSELSREILSASSLPLHKAMARVGFKPKFKQGFLDNFDYKVTCFNNFCDGIVLGKLIEIIYHVNHIGTKLREPKGDRLRKVGNTKVSFEAAKQAGLDLGALKPDAIVAGNKEAIIELLWRLVGVYVLESRQNELRRLSMDLENRRISNIGSAANSTKPDELVLHICRQIGDALGLNVECIDDLKDGRLLAGAWRMYNPQAPDVSFYPGNTLYKQVVSAAESELDVPVGLQGAVQLFSYMYLTRLFDHHKINSAAIRIQRAYRSYRFIKFIKICANTRNYSGDITCDVTCDIQRTYIIPEEEYTSSFNTMSLNEIVEEPNSSEKSDLSTPTNENKVNSSEDLLNQNYRSEIPFRLEEENQCQQTLSYTKESCEGDRLKSIIFIQSCYRGWRARLRYHDLKKEKLLMQTLKAERIKQNAAVIIQKCYRGWSVRCQNLLGSLRMCRLQENSATLIQSYYRGWKARQLVSSLKREKLLKETVEAERLAQNAAVTIQKHYRGWSVRCQNLLGSLRMCRLHENSATLIQSYYRGWQARRLVSSLKREKLLKETLEAERLAQNAAVTIQKHYRGWSVRCQNLLGSLRMCRLQENSAILIQNYYRGWKARQLVSSLKREKLLKETLEAERLAQNAAVTIQKYYRGWSVRCQNLLGSLRMRRLQENGAILIQNYYRGWKARQLVSSLKREKLLKETLEAERLAQNAAVTIQKYYRGWSVRCQNLLGSLRMCRLQENSAVLIQNYYRGWKARQLVSSLKREKLLKETLEAERLAQNAAVTIQKHYRGWIARKDNMLAKETYQQISSDKRSSNSNRIVAPDETIISLRFIYESVRNLQKEQKTIARILEVLKQKQEQKNLSAHLAIMEKAAARIQCWYRGERVRMIYKEELIKRQKLMQFYSQTVLEHNGDDEGFKFKSARQRLSLYSEYLFHDRMYAVKVGAHGINRLTSLIPYFIVEFVESLQGVAVVLDAIENLDRGVSSTEILEILSEILASITKCRDLRVHKPLCEHGEDCVKILFHIFHAYYKNTSITKNAVEGLVALYERPDFKSYFIKLPFYLKSAQRRFERYPTDSQEAKNLRMLQNLIN